MKIMRFFALLFCTISLSAQQQALHKIMPSAAATQPNLNTFLATTAIACATSVIMTKAYPVAVNMSDACYNSYKKDILLEEIEQQSQLNQNFIEQERAKITAERAVLDTRAFTAAKKLLLLTLLYGVVWFIARNLSTSNLYKSESWPEAIAVFIIPSLAAKLVHKSINYHMSRPQPAQHQNGASTQPVIAPRNHSTMATLIITVLITLAQYGALFATHQYFQPYIMPTQQEHTFQFTSYHLAPALCNLIV